MIRIGLDLVELKRVEAIYRRYQSKLGRYLFPNELAFLEGCREKAVGLAKLLALKEAIFKAMGLGWFGLTGWKSVKLAVKDGQWTMDPESSMMNHFKHKRIKKVWMDIKSSSEWVLSRVWSFG